MFYVWCSLHTVTSIGHLANFWKDEFLGWQSFQCCANIKIVNNKLYQKEDHLICIQVSLNCQFKLIYFNYYFHWYHQVYWFTWRSRMNYRWQNVYRIVGKFITVYSDQYTLMLFGWSLGYVNIWNVWIHGLFSVLHSSWYMAIRQHSYKATNAVTFITSG